MIKNDESQDIGELNYNKNENEVEKLLKKIVTK